MYVRDVSWVLLGCYWDGTVHLETVTSGFRFFLTPFCYDFDKWFCHCIAVTTMHTDLYHKLGVVILPTENDNAQRLALKGAFGSVKTYQHKCAK